MTTNEYCLTLLASNLRYYRAENRLSQKGLAELAEVPEMYIQLYERPKIVEDVEKIAKVLGISVDDLVDCKFRKCMIKCPLLQ